MVVVGAVLNLVCGGREEEAVFARVRAAWAWAFGLMEEVSAGEGIFGLVGNPVLSIEPFDEVDADTEWEDCEVAEPETDGRLFFSVGLMICQSGSTSWGFSFMET